MEEITKQVSKARRRLNLQLFLSICSRSLFCALIVALIAIAIPKIWAFDFLADGEAANVWNWSWLGGSLGIGLIISLVIAYLGRKTPIQTAIEVDHEFDLRERVSSAMALSDAERESDFGKALLADAVDRVDRIDIADRFKVKMDWRAFLPLLLAVAAFGIAFGVKNATADRAAAEDGVEQQLKRIQDADEALKKKLEQQLKKAQEKGLENAELAFKEIQSELDKLDPKDKQSTKKMMAKLNDIKKQLEDRQKQLGNTEELKKQLSNMKDIEQGAAEKIAKNMQSGDFDKAQEEIKKLADQLANDSLSDEEKKQVAKQMSSLGEKLDEIAKKNEQAKQQLKEQIEQAKRDGDLDKAAKMQQQLDQRESQQRQMDQLQQMAQQLKQCADCVGNGEKLSEQQMAQAQQALKDLSEQLEQIQKDGESLESIKDVMEQIAECKDMMNGSDFDSLASSGEGDSAGDGSGQGEGQGAGEGSGVGLGEGQGFGARPESETGVGFFDTKVAGKTKEGEAILAGKVDGKVVAGESKAAVREQIESSLSEESDPLTDLRLPRSQRDQAKEYFEKIRTGQ